MLQQCKISKYKTVNGFTRKPCINQIIAYLLIVIINLSFWLLIETKYTNQIFRLFIIPWFSVFLLLLVVFGIISSGIDPSDKIMVQYRNGNPSIINQVSQLCIFCPYCNGYVKRTSKHCKLCDRCVDHFDHHCIWINNCIGSQNYKYFITMIIMAFFFILTYIISVVVLWIQDQWHNFLIEMIVNWIILSINVIFFIFLAALIGLHIYLINNNLTTFEYVLGERTAQIHAEFELKKIQQKKSYIRANEMITIEENNRQNSQQMHKTQNIFESISVCKHSDVKNQEERSQQESVHHMISSRKKMNSLRNQLEFEEDLFNLDNLNAFYKKKKSLKALIGYTIDIKSPISDMH